MPAVVMSKQERHRAIPDTFALLELDGQLDDAVEDLEKTAPSPGRTPLSSATLTKILQITDDVVF